MAVFAGRGLQCVRGERTVFDGLDFSLAAGDALVLTGPNGSGKSSLLRLLAGLLPAAGGSLVWDGAPIADDPARHHARLHYLGHLDAVKPVLTVAENVFFWARLGGSAREPRAALERFGLAHLADSPARYLSAGQRRRLALARLVAAERALWLLDEPTAALDEGAVGALEATLAEHRAQGGLVVLATHLALGLGAVERLDLAGLG